MESTRKRKLEDESAPSEAEQKTLALSDSDVKNAFAKLTANPIKDDDISYLEQLIFKNCISPEQWKSLEVKDTENQSVSLLCMVAMHLSWDSLNFLLEKSAIPDDILALILIRKEPNNDESVLDRILFDIIGIRNNYDDPDKELDDISYTQAMSVVGVLIKKQLIPKDYLAHNLTWDITLYDANGKLETSSPEKLFNLLQQGHEINYAFIAEFIKHGLISAKLLTPTLLVALVRHFPKDPSITAQACIMQFHLLASLAGHPFFDRKNSAHARFFSLIDRNITPQFWGSFPSFIQANITVQQTPKAPGSPTLGQGMFDRESKSEITLSKTGSLSSLSLPSSMEQSMLGDGVSLR